MAAILSRPQCVKEWAFTGKLFATNDGNGDNTVLNKTNEI